MSAFKKVFLHTNAIDALSDAEGFVFESLVSALYVGLSNTSNGKLTSLIREMMYEEITAMMDCSKSESLFALFESIRKTDPEGLQEAEEVAAEAGCVYTSVLEAIREVNKAYLCIKADTMSEKVREEVQKRLF